MGSEAASQQRQLTGRHFSIPGYKLLLQLQASCRLLDGCKQIQWRSRTTRSNLEQMGVSHGGAHVAVA